MEVRDGDGSAATDCSDVQASKCDSQSFTKLIARVHGGCTHVCTANRTCEQGRCAGAFKLVQAINPASCEIAKVEVVVSASEGFARQCCGATVVQHSVISQTCSCEGLHSTSALIANLIVTAHPSYLNEAVHCHSVVLNAQCAAVASGSTCGSAKTLCRYRFYKPTTWFKAPKTAKYTRYDPGSTSGHSTRAGSGSDDNIQELPPVKEGRLSIWHGSLRRWRKCHVSARQIGACAAGCSCGALQLGMPAAANTKSWHDDL